MEGEEADGDSHESKDAEGENTANAEGDGSGSSRFAITEGADTTGGCVSRGDGVVVPRSDCLFFSAELGDAAEGVSTENAVAAEGVSTADEGVSTADEGVSTENAVAEDGEDAVFVQIFTITSSLPYAILHSSGTPMFFLSHFKF